LNIAAEQTDGGFDILGLLVKKNEGAEGGELFILIEIDDGLPEHGAKNFNRGAECKGMERVCEFTHGFFLSVVVVDGEEKAGR